MTTERQPTYAALLAFAKTKCPCICHQLNGGYSPPGYHSYGSGKPDEYGEIRPESPVCKWGCTGLVYLLPDSVRVECRKIHFAGNRTDSSYRIVSCTEDGCPGFYVLDPVTGGDTWAQAVWPLLERLYGLRLGLVSLNVPLRVAVGEYRKAMWEGRFGDAWEVAYHAFVAAGLIEKEEA